MSRSVRCAHSSPRSPAASSLPFMKDPCAQGWHLTLSSPSHALRVPSEAWPAGKVRRLAHWASPSSTPSRCRLTPQPASRPHPPPFLPPDPGCRWHSWMIPLVFRGLSESSGRLVPAPRGASSSCMMGSMLVITVIVQIPMETKLLEYKECTFFSFLPNGWYSTC